MIPASRSARRNPGSPNPLPFLLFQLLLALLLLSPGRVQAGAFDPRGVGARSSALGGAYTAMREDVASIYWNPAALATLKAREFEFSYQDLYSQGLVSFSNLSFAYPEIGPGAMGIGWTRLGATNKVPVDYSENTYTFAYGGHLHEKVSIGASLNYHRLVSVLSGGGFSVNAGLLVTPLPDLSIGALYQNIGKPQIRYSSGARDILPDNFRMGAAYRFRERYTFLADLDGLDSRRLLPHFGLEVSLAKVFDVRGGFARKSRIGSDWLYSLGFGVNFKYLALDYAFENHFDLGPSHVATVSWKF